MGEAIGCLAEGTPASGFGAHAMTVSDPSALEGRLWTGRLHLGKLLKGEAGPLIGYLSDSISFPL